MERQEKFKDRLETAMKIRKMKPVDLHRRTGISESTISQYRSGYAEPKSKKLDTIADALNVSQAWLMGLDVEMNPYPVARSAKIAKSNQNKKGDIQIAYEHADEKTQRAVRILLGIDE